MGEPDFDGLRERLAGRERRTESLGRALNRSAERTERLAWAADLRSAISAIDRLSALEAENAESKALALAAVEQRNHAEAENVRLRGLVEEARMALRPFAVKINRIDADHGSLSDDAWVEERAICFRCAADLLARMEKDK